MTRRGRVLRNVAIAVGALLVVVMVVLVIAGAHQFISLLVPLVLFPALIVVGARRKSVRRRST